MSFTNCPRLGAAMVAALLALLASHAAIAQEEFSPPSGKGRVVVVASGATGIPNYRDVARKIAALGYDAVLFDSNNWAKTQGQGLRDAIAQAQRMPHVRVPTVMLAGENDTCYSCCLIDKARAIGKAAQAAGAPLELTTYPNTQHGFNVLGANYKAQADADAFARTEAALKRNMN
jgi:dienelactone hydrolase